jgi:alkylation response protein AidB-like acyl-CoA dehydrogenase
MLLRFSKRRFERPVPATRTKAVRDRDHYVVNGHKTWTTLAQHAEWIFCLVRTDPQAKAQSGISFLLIDMKTPGVTVRPIITLVAEQELGVGPTLVFPRQSNWRPAREHLRGKRH